MWKKLVLQISVHKQIQDKTYSSLQIGACTYLIGEKQITFHHFVESIAWMFAVATMCAEQATCREIQLSRC